MNLAACLLPVLAAAEGGPAPPPALACLARHYAVTPESEGGAWFARLPDGARLPFDDGKHKSFEERLSAPDVKDIFAVPYRPGAIRPVEAADEDPGRVRVLAILRATYGPHPAPQQVRTRFLGLPVRVHRTIVPALARVAERLERARRDDPSLRPFLTRLSGGFAERRIAGTDRLSAHAFGIAIDLDKSKSDYWRWALKWEPSQGSQTLPRSGSARQSLAPPTRSGWRNRIPQAIVDAFEAEGFIWGGRWYHYDTMHFEYRPELFGPPCREPLTADSRSR
jgi:hypothetical protein